MPDKPRTTSPVKAVIAAKRPRDANGHFIKNDILSVDENNDPDDETLINLKVSNPLHRIIMILKDIKRRQATTIDLKFTIPLIALPVFMIIAFSLGKNSSVLAACGGNIQTKIGLLYTLQATGSNQPGLFEQAKQTVAANLPFLAPILTTNDQRLTTNHQILIQRDNTAITIENPKNIPLTTYNTRQVFVTGKVNTCENTIEVKNDSDVQLLP